LELREGKIYSTSFDSTTPTECIDAYINQKVIITFGKTLYDNPKVDGLIILKGKLEDSDYNEFTENKLIWD